MARKRPSNKAPRKSGPREVDSADARVKPMMSFEDTLDEGEDQFHQNRDKILLDDTSNRNRFQESDDELDQDEEVFALEGIDEEDSVGDEYDDEESFDEEEAEEGPSKRPDSSKGTLPLKGRFAKESDSDEGGSDDEDEEDEETWGANANAYYARPSTRRARDEEESSGDEEINERREMEEMEARKLQRKGREELSNADFGVDITAVDPVEVAVEEELSSVPIQLPTDPEQLLEHLSKTSPEVLALAREWTLISERIPIVTAAIEVVQETDPEAPKLGLMCLHYQTLLTYATTLAFYLHLASLPVSKRPVLSQHPILERLVQLKEGLHQLEELDFAAGGEDDEDLSESDGSEENEFDEEEYGDDPALWEEQRIKMGLEKGELEQLLAEGQLDEFGDEDDVDVDMDMEDGETAAWIQKEKTKAEKSAGKKAKKQKKDSAEPPTDKMLKKKAKKTAYEVLEEPVPSFASSSSSSSSSKRNKSKKLSASPNESDAFHGEQLTLSAVDAAEKASAKHSLRFHTSKIESSAARRSNARKERMGGDEDLPYRSAQASRDAVLKRKAAAALGGASGEGADLDGEEWGEEDRRVADEVRGMGEGVESGDDGYYELVKKRKRKAKEDNQEEYDSMRMQERVAPDDAHDENGGPRALSRSIMKNRGLTPHRSKAVRNPRVKKRMKFEKAKKQVSSKQAVYKGGQSAVGGTYKGESTGISTVIKSRKFQ